DFRSSAHTAAPASAPRSALPISGPGSVRAGIEGSLSATTSPADSTPSTFATFSLASGASGAPCSASRLRWATWLLKSAAPISERIPVTAPSRIARPSADGNGIMLILSLLPVSGRCSQQLFRRFLCTLQHRSEKRLSLILSRFLRSPDQHLFDRQGVRFDR